METIINKNSEDMVHDDYSSSSNFVGYVDFSTTSSSFFLSYINPIIIKEQREKKPKHKTKLAIKESDEPNFLKTFQNVEELFEDLND